MLGTISALIPSDPDYPPRVHTLDVRRRVLDGSLYDALPYEFHEEQNGAGEYVPIRDRRPSVRYNLCRIVVQDCIALLFGEGRFPAVESKAEATRTALADIMAESKFGQVMLDAARAGSVGSACVHMRVLKGRVFFEVLDTRFLAPDWDPQAPDTLLTVIERYKVRGDVLAARGYAVGRDDMQAWHWFQRVWDAEAETWFLPWKVADHDAVARPDPTRSTRHGLGFVPMVWLRNLPGGDALDGASTFGPAIDTSIEIDYQLSQAGRGLKYSSEPTLLIKEPAASTGPMVRSAANALVVSEKGDAKLLEIGGTAAAAVIEYVKCLRELALESIHGNRSSADKISAAQSGRALELMHQPLIWVADQLRVSYGDNGILPLMVMVARASRIHPLTVKGQAIAPLDPTGLTLRWEPWFSPTEHDKGQLASTLATLRAAGLVSRETAIMLADTITSLPDAKAELARILADEAQARQAAAEPAESRSDSRGPEAQSKVTETAKS